MDLNLFYNILLSDKPSYLIKKNEEYDMKKDKSSIIISSMMILLSTSYLAFLLII